jgi:hypothetical protein
MPDAAFAAKLIDQRETGATNPAARAQLKVAQPFHG